MEVDFTMAGSAVAGSLAGLGLAATIRSMAVITTTTNRHIPKCSITAPILLATIPM
jgi:hypothetical protein